LGHSGGSSECLGDGEYLFQLFSGKLLGIRQINSTLDILLALVIDSIGKIDKIFFSLRGLIVNGTLVLGWDSIVVILSISKHGVVLLHTPSAACRSSRANSLIHSNIFTFDLHFR